MTEEEILAKYSTPGLRKNALNRAAKKLNMEFDGQFHGYSSKEREAFLDLFFPEGICSS